VEQLFFCCLFCVPLGQVIAWYFAILQWEHNLVRGRLTNDSLSERLLTRDRITVDSLVGVRLLAEMVRTTAAPGHEYLRVLNRQTRMWKEKAQELAEAWGPDHIQGRRTKKKGKEVDCL
jgi:hypothetical protein